MADTKRRRMTVAEERALRTELAQLRLERFMLAQLAAETPQFDSPIMAWAAKALRDRVLAEGV